jgi:hypothetical protein
MALARGRSAGQPQCPVNVDSGRRGAECQTFTTRKEPAGIARNKAYRREKGFEAQPLRGHKEGYRTGLRPSLGRLRPFWPPRRLSARARCAGCNGLRAKRLCGLDFFLR